MVLLLEFFIRALGSQEDMQGSPSITPGGSVSGILHISAPSAVLGHTFPQDSLVLALGSDYPTSLPGNPSHPLVFLYFLFIPEEDPCECESIVKFQAKVEGLLQALTRKHILPRG